MGNMIYFQLLYLIFIVGYGLWVFYHDVVDGDFGTEEMVMVAGISLSFINLVFFCVNWAQSQASEFVQSMYLGRTLIEGIFTLMVFQYVKHSTKEKGDGRCPLARTKGVQ